MEPVYATQNTRAAYQLNWSLSLFGKSELPEPNLWQESLGSAVEPDGVRIVNSSTPDGNVIQFLISSQPAIAPSAIVRSVKGRLQYTKQSGVSNSGGPCIQAQPCAWTANP